MKRSKQIFLLRARIPGARNFDFQFIASMSFLSSNIFQPLKSQIWPFTQLSLLYSSWYIQCHNIKISPLVFVGQLLSIFALVNLCCWQKMSLTTKGGRGQNKYILNHDLLFHFYHPLCRQGNFMGKESSVPKKNPAFPL